jgi:hypothetical protein
MRTPFRRLDTQASERNLQEIVADLAGGYPLLGSELVHAVVDPGSDSNPRCSGRSFSSPLRGRATLQKPFRIVLRAAA